MGRPRKSIQAHIDDGTYQPCRHGKESSPLSLQKPDLSKLPTLRETKKWIRSESDERAVANGCRFSVELAVYVQEWVRKYIKHSEGIWAGDPFEFMDWQRDELFFPLFGWVRMLDEPPFDGRIARRFKRVYVELPKKGGKSPTGAVIGVYLWAGDGEQGAKIFSAATDREQAGIVHDHAMNMVEDSPEILALSRINRTTRKMTFTPTRSVYGVLTQEQGGAKRSEGKNSNGIIGDEIHVWRGDEFYKSLRYAFATRPEPVFLGITTAGDNMDSVCRQLHDYTVGIKQNTIQDDSFLGIIYAADEDDDWLSEDTWKKANPSIGTTVPLSEMREAAIEAKTSPRMISAFKRYRLNIWNSSESVWLDMDKWRECEESYTLEDMRGMTCFAGLDLSKCLDFTSLTLVFPLEDGTFRQMVDFWLPESTIEERRHLASYEAWRDAGYLRACPGNVIHYGMIQDRLLELDESLDLREVAFDPMLAEPVLQPIREEMAAEQVQFDQTILAFAEPASEYERLVNSTDLKHNGNPILSWQASHCHIWQDRNGNIRPTKPKRGDYRTIDGIVGGIMGLGRAMVAVPEQTSIYSTMSDVSL